MKISLLLSLTLLTHVIFAQQEYGRSVCKELASEKYYGRGYIKGGDSLAALFIADEFKKLGAQPLFSNTYFQDFQFPINTFPTDVVLKINGKELELGKDYIPSHASGAFTGEWKLRALSETDIFSNTTIQNVIDSTKAHHYNGFVVRNNNYKDDSLKQFSYVYRAFSTLGNVIRLSNSKLIFSASTRQNQFAEFIVMDSVVETIQSVYSDVRPVFNERHATQNVIAHIPATKKNAPYIVFTAHYDHLGGIGDEVYFPGASDNASGVSMLLAMAKHYAKNPAKYNLVFMAFAGEEAGLIGSHYYVEHPIFPLEKIKFLVNLDLMGNGEDGITMVNGTVFPKQFKIFAKINKKKKYLPVMNQRGKAANSDHHFFTEAGVPSFFIYTMGKNQNYHDIFDTYEALSFAKFDEIVHLLIDFVAKI